MLYLLVAVADQVIVPGNGRCITRLPADVARRTKAGMDDLEPHRLEQLRRSIAMLPPGRRDGLDREKAIAIIEELQRLQRSDRRYRDLVDQLRELLATE